MDKDTTKVQLKKKKKQVEQRLNYIYIYIYILQITYTFQPFKNMHSRSTPVSTKSRRYHQEDDSR